MKNAANEDRPARTEAPIRCSRPVAAAPAHRAAQLTEAAGSLFSKSISANTETTDVFDLTIRTGRRVRSSADAAPFRDVTGSPNAERDATPHKAGGWILYDGRCPICRRGVRRFGRILRRLGYRPAPLQRRWVRDRLGLSEAELMREMRVLTADGRVYGGADAMVFLAGQIWWAKPLSWVGRSPAVMPMLRRLYRWVASRRPCTAACPSARARGPDDPSNRLTRFFDL